MSRLDSEWLTREQIDEVLSALSAADLIEGVGDGKHSEARLAGIAFDAAAARVGVSNGSPATQHIRAGDFKYLATRISEVVNVDSPLSESTSALLDSPDDGE